MGRENRRERFPDGGSLGVGLGSSEVLAQGRGGIRGAPRFQGRAGP